METGKRKTTDEDHRARYRASEAEPTFLQVYDDVEQVRQETAETGEPLNDEHIAKAQIDKTGFQPRMVVAQAEITILMQVGIVDTDGGKGITLQVDRLTVVRGGHAHVADQY